MSHCLPQTDNHKTMTCDCLDNLLEQYEITHVSHSDLHFSLIIQIEVLVAIGFPLCLSLSSKSQLLLDLPVGYPLFFLSRLLVRRGPKPAKHSYVQSQIRSAEKCFGRRRECANVEVQAKRTKFPDRNLPPNCIIAEGFFLMGHGGVARSWAVRSGVQSAHMPLFRLRFREVQASRPA